MVAYYVFDLDGTLTDQYSYFYFLADFKPRGIYKEKGSATVKHENLIQTHQSAEVAGLLEKAYKEFVRLVAVKEASDTPLGILRPGVIDVCREILHQKESGVSGGALMYSNNPNPMILEFVRDIIHTVLGQPIFCSLAYWGHPLRTSEITLGIPGMAKKTWRVLQQIIKKECGAQNVAPQNVMFFDDQSHPNLETILPEGNYVKVTPYTFKPSIDTIKPLYIQAMKRAGLGDERLKSSLVNYIRNVQTDFYGPNNPTINSLSSHILRIKKNSPNAAAPGTNVPPPDNSSQKMLSEVSQFPERPVTRGGNRRTRRTRSSRHHSTTRKR